MPNGDVTALGLPLPQSTKYPSPTLANTNKLK